PGVRTVTRPFWAFAAVVAGIAALTIAGCDTLPGRPNVAKREVVPTQGTAFDPLYRTNCAGCHGAHGRLGAARPLHAPAYLPLVPAERLRSIIRGGVTGTSMPAFGIAAGGELTDAQVDAVAKGMVARWGRSDAVRGLTLPSYDAPAGASGPDARERGAAVYA